MKSILLIIFTSLVINISLAQTENIEMENGRIIWQNIYDSNMTKEQLFTLIENSGQFEINT